ncbi:MAG: nuclear transport factor 2 family protein [Verrucomicrobiota bacterium]
MAKTKKEQISALLKAIETGDPEAVAVVNEAKYIQHNPLTREGSVGLAELFKRLAKTSPRVEIVRVFEDGDFVFAHTDYDFNVVEVGFEVFRFEDGFVVEHWDNLQSKPDRPNPSGHTMLDGATETADVEKTEENRELVRAFVEEVLLKNQPDLVEQYVAQEGYVEHNLQMSDGLPALRQALTRNEVCRSYEQLHRLLAEGNFVLSVCEGHLGDDHVSFYDLFRLADGKIVEHWDIVDKVPPRSEWVNDNGKF